MESKGAMRPEWQEQGQDRRLFPGRPGDRTRDRTRDRRQSAPGRPQGPLAAAAQSSGETLLRLPALGQTLFQLEKSLRALVVITQEGSHFA